MFQMVCLEFFEIKTQSKSVSFISYPYYPAQICICPDSKRCLVCHMAKMKEEQIFLKYIPNTYCVHVIFLNMFHSKNNKRIEDKKINLLPFKLRMNLNIGSH